jgi:hypothetical protein
MSLIDGILAPPNLLQSLSFKVEIIRACELQINHTASPQVGADV